MRFSVVFFLCFFIVLSSRDFILFSRSQDKIVKNKKDNLKYAIVRITDGRQAIGSGSLVALKNGRAYILSSNHVIRDIKEITLELFSEKSYPNVNFRLVNALPINSSIDSDLALLSVPYKRSDALTFISISSKKPAIEKGFSASSISNSDYSVL